MTSINSPVRVRMAPSPTGLFHVGSARTALFNYLFARHHGGTMVLRIEDTDTKRNQDEWEEIIYQAMEWLGLEVDESPLRGGDYGPYRQSERLELYQKYAAQLLASGAAYKAYETPDELDAMRRRQQEQKLPPRYDGSHRELTPAQQQAFEAAGRRPALRLRVPPGHTSWRDLVRGEVTWSNAEIDDWVLLKSDGGPTYNFACVVDDYLMRITHVIRGEDGINNTPRQMMVYQALGWELPQFAHVPFLLGKDRSKLSKRHGSVNLLEFRERGILPEAMFNYLALLGWNPGEGETRELFSRDELIQWFSLEGVNKAGAIFDEEKLQWMNAQYLRHLPMEEFAVLARPYLGEVSADPVYVAQALGLARQRINYLSELPVATQFFFSDDYELETAGTARHLNAEAGPRLRVLADRLEAVTSWSHDDLESALRGLAGELEIKPAALIHPARLAVSGRSVGPGIFELLEALGRERVVPRLRRVADQLANAA